VPTGVIAYAVYANVTSLIAFDVIPPTPGLAIGLTAVLLVADVTGWWIVAPLFDRERLITGTR
jgi:hypothetical protein